MRVAVVHDWLSVYAGGERVLEQILSVFPSSDLYTLVDFLPDEDRRFLGNRKVTTSFIQRLPFSRSRYRHYLPLMPIAVEQFDLSDYDLIISSSHAVAKGVLTGPNQLHICYCHSPIRYAWDLQHQYLRESTLDKGLKGSITKMLLHYMRLWDVRTSNGVDIFIANSRFISKRIWKVYRRDSMVVYPPVDIDRFPLNDSKREDFYLTASRMVPYKRIDLVVEAFSRMPEKRLVVIGDGPEFAKIRAKAGPNVDIMGYQPHDVLSDHMRRARAFIFAAEEDFGITPVEAQACGTPVIAYGKGGVLETVIDGKTGVFFREQTCSSIIDAITYFEKEFHQLPHDIRAVTERFGLSRFREELAYVVEQAFVDNCK